MNNILERIAHHADIDTRRAMGFPPRKLDPSWKEFRPKGFFGELYRYYVKEKRLEYFEAWEYNHIFYEVITDTQPRDADNHQWMTCPDSYTRTVMHSDNRTKVYIIRTHHYDFNTAGWPSFIY